MCVNTDVYTISIINRHDPQDQAFGARWKKLMGTKLYAKTKVYKLKTTLPGCCEVCAQLVQGLTLSGCCEVCAQLVQGLTLSGCCEVCVQLVQGLTSNLPRFLGTLG